MEEERTARGFFLAPPSAEEECVEEECAHEDRTMVERGGALTYLGRDAPVTVFTPDMVEELRRRLREAEAREGSGVRVRPTPEEGIARGEALLDRGAGRDLDVSVDVEEPRTPEELDEVVSALPELEVVLAPESESNFYAGFDDEHPDGVFLATYTSMAVGTPIYLALRLPAGYSFRTPAIVEWVRSPDAAAPGAPAGIGFRMCGLDVRTRRLIRAFVRHRRPLFYVG